MRSTHPRSWTPFAAAALLLAGCDLKPPPSKAAVLQPEGQTLTACTRCHGGDLDQSGAPPIDAHGQRATTAIGVGAHQAHLGAALSAPVACEACHVVPASADDGHIDGVSRVALGKRAFTDRFATAAWDPASATCAVYCHGATLAGGSAQAPVWTKVDGSQRTCGSCHGAPPPAPHPSGDACGTCHDGYTGTSVVAATHVDGEVQVSLSSCTACHGYPPAAPHAQSDACATCHSGTVNADGTLVPGGLHLNGTVDVTAYHDSGWSNPTNHGLAANRDLASCKSCHGADLAGGSVGVSCADCHGTGWQSSCTFCHGDPQRAANQAAPPQDTQNGTATTARGVGAHQTHLAGNALSNAIACAECHASPSDLGHVDGTVALAFGALARTGGANPAWNGTAATCATVYCHGQFPGGNMANAPVWTKVDGTQGACGTCHAVPPPAPHTTRTDCGACHDGYTSSTVNLATHIDGQVEASGHADGWVDKTQHGYTANRNGLADCKTCHGTDLASCTTCHASNGFSSWSTSCTFCHGDRLAGRASPPVDTQGGSARTNTSVGAHAKHVAPAMMGALDCTACHPSRGDVVLDAAHVDGDGIAEVAFAALAKTGGAAATYTRASATSASCASTYCHGRFTGGVNSGAGATVSWTSTTAMSCTSCHGNPPGTGRHSTHSGRASCNNCHNSVVSASNAIAAPALHVNGAKDVKLGGVELGTTTPVSGTWNASTRTCSPSCHGSKSW